MSPDRTSAGWPGSADRRSAGTARRVAMPRAALLLGALAVVTAGPPVAAERVTLRTTDGVTLAATWHGASVRPAPAVILVHMLNRSRRELEGIAERLAAEGIGALAIDLRGHGESGRPSGAGDGPRAYESMVQDLKAARQHLAGRGDVRQTQVGIIGASIGANLAALAAAGDASIASLALLSPSLDYRGLRIEPALRSFGARPVLLVASDDDPYAWRSARALQKAGSGPRELLLLQGAGHGSLMLARAPDLPRALVDWFRRTLL